MEQASDLKAQKDHFDQRFDSHLLEVNQLKEQLKAMATQTAALTLERKELRQALANVNTARSTMQKKTPMEKADRTRERKARTRERADLEHAELLSLRKQVLGSKASTSAQI